MKRVTLVIGVLFAMTACGAPNPDRATTERTDSRYFPENTTPGLHVSGRVEIGIVKKL